MVKAVRKMTHQRCFSYISYNNKLSKRFPRYMNSSLQVTNHSCQKWRVFLPQETVIAAIFRVGDCENSAMLAMYKQKLWKKIIDTCTNNFYDVYKHDRHSGECKLPDG